MLTGNGILSDFQKTFLRLFAEVPDQERFYLTGGTALAEYYLAHRLSYDLDLFTSEAELILPFSYQLEKAAESAGLQVLIVRRFASFVEYQVKRGGESLKVDLALDSPFRFAPTIPGETGVMVNDFVDLQADKTLAFFGRAEPRDAIDLYFLLQRTGFDTLAELARQKDAGFDPYWFAVALNRASGFPDEIERWPVKMLIGCDPREIKRVFLSLANQIMSQQTGNSA
jgi:hypothetical protein